MQIEITGETERLVQAILATGEFASVDDFVASMARRASMGEAMSVLKRNGSIASVDQLAAEQRIEPIRDFRSLKADFWPDGESVDDFVGSIQTLREDSLPRRH